jgi:hypothetical protein
MPLITKRLMLELQWLATTARIISLYMLKHWCWNAGWSEYHADNLQDVSPPQAREELGVMVMTKLMRNSLATAAVVLFGLAQGAFAQSIRRVPEGGSDLVYLALAGISCVGAIFYKTRR